MIAQTQKFALEFSKKIAESADGACGCPELNLLLANNTRMRQVPKENAFACQKQLRSPNLCGYEVQPASIKQVRWPRARAGGSATGLGAQLALLRLAKACLGCATPQLAKASLRLSLRGQASWAPAEAMTKEQLPTRHREHT